MENSIQAALMISIKGYRIIMKEKEQTLPESFNQPN
jgi:hypothetical protein